MVNCQFGEDGYIGCEDNLPDEWRQKMTEGFDRHYNLHIDSLAWMNHDYDWQRYFYHFPRPQVPTIPDEDKEVINNLPKDPFIVVSLVSESSGEHRLEDWFVTNLIKRLAKNHPVVVLSTPKINSFYEGVKDTPNVTVLNVAAASVFTVISKASLMVATDTGLKYLAYCFDVPTLEFSGQSTGPHQVLPSHEVRWLIYPKRCFPRNFDLSYVSDCAFRIMKDKGYALIPQITDLDNQLVRRIYKVNHEKSILNA